MAVSASHIPAGVSIWKLFVDLFLVSGISKWPKYTSESTNSNFVLRWPRNESYAESDTYRADGIKYINSIAR
jgi:hypothetical protein